HRLSNMLWSIMPMGCSSLVAARMTAITGWVVNGWLSAWPRNANRACAVAPNVTGYGNSGHPPLTSVNWLPNWKRSAPPLKQLREKTPDRQHPLLQISIFQFNPQFVLPAQFVMPLALDKRNDLHRVDRRVRHELDLNGLG